MAPTRKKYWSTRFCKIREIADGDAREVNTGGENPLMVLILRHERVYAQVNSCPEALMALNWASDQFLFTAAGKRLCTQLD